MRSSTPQLMCTRLPEGRRDVRARACRLCITILAALNQPFGEWGTIFTDPAMTLAAVDRLVHHATIFEMNVESYRRRTAIDRKRGPGRPAHYATPKNVGPVSPRDNQSKV